MVPNASTTGGLPASAGTVQRLSIPEQPELVEDRDQPLYVNAKQYHRILKRRQARAKLEAQGKIPKERRVSHLNPSIKHVMFEALIKIPEECRVSNYNLNVVTLTLTSSSREV